MWDGKPFKIPLVDFSSSRNRFNLSFMIFNPTFNNSAKLSSKVLFYVFIYRVPKPAKFVRFQEESFGKTINTTEG